MRRWAYITLEQTVVGYTSYGDPKHAYAVPGSDESERFKTLIDGLQALGAQGWECAGIISMPSAIIGRPLYEYAVLKRPVEDE